MPSHAALAAIAAILLLATPAAAQTGSTSGWTTFTDPVEHAFTIDIPQGWRADGGVRRVAPSDAPAWVTAQSPDGRMQLFLNDPAIGTFTVPGGPFVEGGQTPGVHGRPSPIQRYRPGAEFAAAYGLHSLATACTGIRVTKTEPLPAVQDSLRQIVQTATRLDGGAAEFACTRDGQPISATVVAGTALTTFPGGGGVWQVPILLGARAPTGQEEQAAQLLLHMQGTYKADPQFLANLRAAGEAEEAAARLAAQNQAAGPRPTPYQPARPTGPRCDDLQQQRICAINNGHVVPSGGCLRCIGP